MENPSDNIFELGLLYKAIQALKLVRDQTLNKPAYKPIRIELNKAIGKLKETLVKEIESL